MRVYNHENRLTVDDCAQISRESQNQSINLYNIENTYYSKDCKCPANSDFVLDNNMTIKDGFGFSSGCAIDTDSDLRLGGKLTNERTKSQLSTRWYQGNPNLNKGGLLPNIDTIMKNGDDTTDIRSCDRIAERDYNRFTPLVGCLAGTIQNPDFIIDPWTRGGDHTRNDVRSSEYLEKCGFENNGYTWVRKNIIS